MGGAEARRPRRAVTSIDVARAADVSQATVSRAFSAPDRVAPEKRERILETAAELGYVPNAIGRSLSSQSSRIIAVVVPAASEYYQHALAAFAEGLLSAEYQMLLFESNEADDMKVIFSNIPRYHVDGVIVASSLVPVAQVERLASHALPVLMFNQDVAVGEVPSISVDNEAGTRALARHLVETGHSSVTFVGGIRSASTDRARYRGAAEELADAGVACRYTEAGSYSYEAGLATAESMSELPDAIMAASDAIAFGLMDGLRAAGVSIPTDVSITGFDGLPQAAWRSYDLTTIEQPMTDLAQLGVASLVDRIEHDVSSTPRRQLLEGSFIQRGTVRGAS